MKKSVKAHLSYNANERQPSLRQLSQPVRPLSSKHKHLEMQLAKLNAELELTSLSPLHQRPQPIHQASSNSLNRRSHSKEQNAGSIIQKNNSSAKRLGVRRQQVSLGPPAISTTISPISTQKHTSIKFSIHPENNRPMSGSRHRISDTFQEKKGSESRSIIDSSSSRQNIHPATANGPKQTLNKHVANIHYYSNSKVKGKDLARDHSQISNQLKINGAQEEELGLDDNSDPIINVSSAYLDSRKDFEPLPAGVNSLHEGIQFLQENLKQLEGKYNDLTSLYKQKDKLSSPDSQYRPEKKPESQLDKELKHFVDSKTVKSDSGIKDLLETFQVELRLSRDQTKIYDRLKSELPELLKMSSQSDKTVSDLIMGMEYSFTEVKETTFKIKHISDSIGIDVKKMIRSLSQFDLKHRELKPVADVVVLLEKSREKLVRQEFQFNQLEKIQLDLTKNMVQFSNLPSGPVKKTNNLDVQLQVQQLKEQLAQKTSMEISQIQGLSKAEAQLADLRAQNQDLRTKIDIQNIDLRQKQLLLTQRESQKQEISQQLSLQAQTSRDVRNLQSSEERLRHTLETLVHLTNRFLTAMRKLQKVVHKREPNVNQEKQDFETAKRDLELTLKSIVTAIFPKDSGRQSVSDTSDIPHKHDKQIKLRQRTDATPPLNLKIQVSQDRSTIDDNIPTAQQPTLMSNRVATTDRHPEEKSLAKNSFGQKISLKSKETSLQMTLSPDKVFLTGVTNFKQSISTAQSIQTDFLFQTMNRLGDFNQRLQNVLNQHAELKRLNNYLQSQLSVQTQNSKTKETELMVTKSELSTAKADLKMQLTKLQESQKLQTEGYVAEIKKLKSTNVNSSQINQLVQERESILNGLESALLQKGLELHTKEAALQECQAEKGRLADDMKRLQKQVDDSKNVVIMLKKEYQNQATKREEAHMSQITEALHELQTEHETTLETFEQKAIKLQEDRHKERQASRRVQEELEIKVSEFSRINTLLTHQINALQQKDTLSTSVEEGLVQLKTQLKVEQSRISELEDLCQSQSQQLKQQDQLSEQLRTIILNIKTEHQQVKTSLQTKIAEKNHEISLHHTQSEKILTELQNEHDQVLQTASNAFQSEMSKVKSESIKVKNQLLQESDTLKQSLQDKKLEIRNLIQAVQQKEDELTLRKQEHKQFVVSSNKESQECSAQIETLQQTIQSLQQQISHSNTVSDQSVSDAHQLEEKVSQISARCEMLGTELAEAGMEVKGLRDALQTADSQLQSERTDNESLSQMNQALKEKVNREASLFAQGEAQNKELTAQLAILTKSLEEAENKCQDTKVKLESQMENSLLSLDQQRHNIVQDLEERLRLAQEHLQGIQQTSEVLRQNISDQSDTILDLQTQFDLKCRVVRELEAQLGQSTANLNVLQNELGLLTEQFKDKTAETEALLSRLSQENARLSAEFESESQTISELGKQNQEYLASIKDLRQQSDQKDRENAETVEQMNADHEERVAEIQQHHQQVQNDLSKYLSNLEALTVVKQSAINEVEAGLKQTRAKMQEQSLQHQNKIAELQTNMQTKVGEFESTIEDLRLQLSKSDLVQHTDTSELETRLTHVQNLLEQKQTQLEDTLNQLSVSNEENQKLVQQTHSLEERDEVRHKKMGDLKESLQQSKQQVAKLEQEFNDFRNQASDSKKSLVAKAQKHVQIVRLQFTTFKDETLKVLQTLFPDEHSFSSLIDYIKQLGEDCDQLRRDLSELSDQNESEKQGLLESKLASENNLRLQFENEVQQIEQQSETVLISLKEELKSTQDQLLGFKSQIFNLNEEKATLQLDRAQREQSLREQLNTQQEKFDMKIRAEQQGLLEHLQQAVSNMTDSSVPINKNADKLIRRIESLQQAVEEARQVVAEQKEALKLETEKHVLAKKSLELKLNELEVLLEQRADELAIKKEQFDKLEKKLQDQVKINADLSKAADEIVVRSKQASQIELEDSLASQTSLVVENAQLLERLQRVESVLKETREKQSTKNQNPDSESRFADFENRLEKQRTLLTQTKQDVLSQLVQKIEYDIESTKQAYIEDRILTHGLNEYSSVRVWNDLVKVVSRILINDQPHLVVQTKDGKLFILNKSELHEAALNYLESFAADNTSQLNLEEVNPEMASLQELLTELCRDLAELHLEFSKVGTENGGKSVDLSIVGMKDEVEFLAGENRDLRLKVKQLCMSNAQMKLQIISLTEFNLNAVIKDDEGGYIETARNISDLVDEDPYAQEEHKEQTDFLSDQESFGLVVNGMSKLDTSTERRLEFANSQIENLKSQLKQRNDRSDFEEDTATTIAHIKGTLIQFLKTTPFTDRQNEELLKIVFSMMEFNPLEITELQNSRMVLKGNNKAVQQSIQNSSSRVNTSGVSSEGDKRIKKGILGLFSKAKSTNANNNSATIGSTFAPPQQPVKR